jgi:hypothetical protein
MNASGLTIVDRSKFQLAKALGSRFPVSASKFRALRADIQNREIREKRKKLRAELQRSNGMFSRVSRVSRLPIRHCIHPAGKFCQPHATLQKRRTLVDAHTSREN